MIYEPHTGDSLEFVWVEYILPFSLVGPDEHPPVFFWPGVSEEFDRQTLGFHAWVGRDNPHGEYAPRNPVTPQQSFLLEVVPDVLCGELAPSAR